MARPIAPVRGRAALALLADDAAAAAAGIDVHRGAGRRPTSRPVAIEDAIGTPPTGDRVGARHGLTVEPRLLPDQHWPQLFQLARAAPGAIALGIDVGTAVRITDTGAPTVAGDSAVVAVDSSRATFATGDNGAIGASWLLLDTFVAGDAVAP